MLSSGATPGDADGSRSPSRQAWNSSDSVTGSSSKQSAPNDGSGVLGDQSAAEPAQPGQLLRDLRTRAGRGVARDDARVAGVAGPRLEVGVVGEAALGGVVGDLLGDLVGLGHHDPVAGDRPATEVVGGLLATSLSAARADGLETVLGLGGVLDLRHEDRGRRLVPTLSDRGDGEAVAQPRLEVVGVVEVVARSVLQDLLDDPLAQVVVGVEPDLVLERRELAQRREGRDLLAAAGVEVDAEVAQRLGRQGLGRLRAGAGEPRVGTEGRAPDREHADHTADHEPLAAAATAAARGRGGRERTAAARTRAPRAARTAVVRPGSRTAEARWADQSEGR